MSPDILPPHNQGEIEARRANVEAWCIDILPLLDRYPQLQTTDLVIEGGCGTSTLAADIARRLFPNALYVGMDLAPTVLGTSGGRLINGIDESNLSRLQAANATPSLGMPGARVLGNCFDIPLIQDIAAKTGSQHSVLLSDDALNAFLDRKMNPWYRKDSKDETRMATIVSPSLPYRAQIHIGMFWEDMDESHLDWTERNFLHLETAGQENGWITERFDCGLLLLRP